MGTGILASAGRHVVPRVFGSIGAENEEYKKRHGWKITRPEDWKNPDEIPAVLMAINSEVAEAFEAFRVDDRELFEDELADIIIRTVGLAHGMKIDIGAAILRKLEKNNSRPYRHGGKRV